MSCKAFIVLVLGSVLVTGCASTLKTTADIERKHYSDWEKSVGYTQVVRVGDTLYVSGIGSSGKTLEEQLQGIYQTIARILADHQATADHIVKEVIYTTDMDQLIAAIPARKGYFNNGNYPGATWVQVERLYSPEMQVEIELVVQIPAS